MGREVKRVPMDFDYPLKKVWDGYLMPEELLEPDCPLCDGTGYSPQAKIFADQWYGNGEVPFVPKTPHTYQHPAIQAFARRNVESSPEFYGTGSIVVENEARRLARMWDRQWAHHLDEDDVAVLIKEDRLRDLTHTWTKEDGWQPNGHVPTPDEVNTWSMSSIGHDAINRMICVEARCEREGVEYMCEVCLGHGQIEAYPGQREDSENWEPTDPPVGEGWQMWETTSEGSPTSPVFSTPEGLAAYCVHHVSLFGSEMGTYQQWLAIIQGDDFAHIQVGNAILM